MSTLEDASGRLDSWKAIAAYLKRDERTVRRWERELGLPVRRVPGGRGRSVFAYTSEIDAWLKSASFTESSSQIPTAAEALTAPSRRWRLPALASGFALLVMGLGWWTIASSATANPVRADISAAGIVARDAADQERWRYAFPIDERAAMLDERTPEILTGSDPEVLGATSFRVRIADEAISSGQLLSLSVRGTLQRTFAFDDQLTFGAGRYAAPWAITDFRSHEGTGARRIAVAAHHYTWWPSMVTILDEDWRRRGTFVHAGWIERLHWLTPDRLLIAGFSQARDGGMIALLDAGALDGQAPVDADSAFSCIGCGPGGPLRYLVMPRTEVNRVTGSRFNRAKMQPVGGRLVVRTIEVPGEEEEAADVVYEFTTSLDLVSASFSTRYWQIHAALEAEGKLDHAREQCPDRDGPREILVWERQTGWRAADPRGR